MTQPLQLSTAQLAQAEKAFKAKLDAKTLECASLRQLIDYVPALAVKKVFTCSDNESENAVITVVVNYLTAKLHQAVIELQELELQLKGIQAMSNRIQPAVLTGR